MRVYLSLPLKLDLLFLFQFCEWEDNDVHDISDVGESIFAALRTLKLFEFLSCHVNNLANVNDINAIDKLT